MQKWTRLNNYTSDYLDTVYNYYAKHGVAYPCIYYHYDIENSDVDLDVLESGAYETFGDLSGMVWEKIIMLPVYNIDQMQPTFTADERGFGKFDQISSFNMPSIYGITPTAKDFVIFSNDILNYDDQLTTAYQVTGFEKATNTDISFWKINIKTTSRIKINADQKTRETFVFLDYEKTIYNADDSVIMLSLLDMQTNIDMNDSYSKNTNLYFGS